MVPLPSVHRSILIMVVACGCAGEPSFPLPMTAVQLTQYANGPALVAYLSQPDASPTVCELRSQGPHLPLFDDDMRLHLVRGLADGRIAPDLWRRCADALLRRLPEEGAASLMDAIAEIYRGLLVDSDLDGDPARQARLNAMLQLYGERKPGILGHSLVQGRLFDRLRHALEAHRLGATARRYGADLLELVDLELGRWRGRPVDLPAIDALFAASDEKQLRRFADRLPKGELRDQARRRVIRLRIAASPYPEVRARAAVVEELVMEQGAWRLQPSEFPAVRGWLDLTRTPMRGVWVRQRVREGRATLLGYSGERPEVSVLPEVSLRGALLVEVKGISRAVTLCGEAKELDPTPCIAARDLKLDNPMAYLDKGGAFHFADTVSMKEAVELTKMRGRFSLPVSYGGQELLTFNWKLSYERPDDLIFTGPAPGTPAPNIGVLADRRDPNRFIFTVTGGGVQVQAVVEAVDAPAFQVVSRGAQGFTGSTGASGSTGHTGSAGHSASCPGSPGGSGGQGGRGGDGGPGGPGGPGGDGGDLLIDVACGAPSCTEVIQLLTRTVRSEGGPGGFGGSGGSGGSGGAGGPGGSGASCTDSQGHYVSVSGGSAGSQGPSGSQGTHGPPGHPGQAGQVTFRIYR
jgi:hypothetical protein